MNEIYVSTDIEADGPIPGENSMLSIGSAAFQPEGTLVGTFSANLHLLGGAQSNSKTMEWWERRPQAWNACREDLEPPERAMWNFHNWVMGLPGKPVFVGCPAGYDFMFVYWYLIKFVGHSPFSHSALDMKTYAMALLNTPYRESVKGKWPKNWFDESTKHTHVALDDAIEQGRTFCRMLASRTELLLMIEKDNEQE